VSAVILGKLKHKASSDQFYRESVAIGNFYGFRNSKLTKASLNLHDSRHLEPNETFIFLEETFHGIDKPLEVQS